MTRKTLIDKLAEKGELFKDRSDENCCSGVVQTVKPFGAPKRILVGQERGVHPTYTELYIRSVRGKGASK